MPAFSTYHMRLQHWHALSRLQGIPIRALGLVLVAEFFGPKKADLSDMVDLYLPEKVNCY